MNPVISISCTRCGKRFPEPDLAGSHTDHCRPRFWYWWPREYPYLFALIWFVMGISLGWLIP